MEFCISDRRSGAGANGGPLVLPDYTYRCRFMLIVHHELLPECYLLVLAPDAAQASELELAQHLSCAVRSGKPAVWVDCRLLDTISLTAVRLLWACHHRLKRRGAELVLCRVSEPLAQALRRHYIPTDELCVVASLDDAAQQLP